MKNRRAFTLIELILAMAGIGRYNWDETLGIGESNDIVHA